MSTPRARGQDRPDTLTVRPRAPSFLAREMRAMKTMRPMTPFRTAARFAAAVALLLPARAAFAQPAAAGPGAGPPLFRPAPGSPFGPGAAPSDVAAADVNGDRKLDLVV